VPEREPGRIDVEPVTAARVMAASEVIADGVAAHCRPVMAASE
jgi:hypothetical protein